MLKKHSADHEIGELTGDLYAKALWTNSIGYSVLQKCHSLTAIHFVEIVRAILVVVAKKFIGNTFIRIPASDFI